MKKSQFTKLLSLIFGEIRKRLEPLNKRSEDLGMELNLLKEKVAAAPIKGDKGDDGHTPTKEELVSLVTPLLPTEAQWKEFIAPLVPAPVKGEDGKTPTIEELKELIVPLIPAPLKGDKGEDGKTPTIEELKELIVPLIPAPVKGEDGKTPTIEELKELIVPLIPAPVKGEDGKTPTIEELKELIVPLIPAPVNGEDGRTPSEDELRALITPLIPAPIKGQDGKDGVSPTAESVALVLREHTRSFVTEPEFMRSLVEAVPRPRDGLDGKSVTVDDVRESLTLMFSQWALEFERRGHDAIQRAIDNMPKPKDGISIDDFEFDGDRRLTCKSAGAVIKTIVLPSIIDRGVWKESDAYERGDAVSFGGNLWIAQCDTDVKPGPAGGEDGSKHWRLAVRKGRDARDR